MLGQKVLALLKQGAIGKIVTAKPEDRRVLIEEAAGITKFKARKRESQRKLNTTESNLVRLQDIIGELKRQLDSLQRQAHRAERYRKLKREVEDIELWLTSKEYLGLKDKTQQAQADFEQAQNQQVESQTGLGTNESELAELRASSLEREKVIEDFRMELKQNQEKVREKENLIQELRFEIEQAKRSKEMAGSLIDENKIRETTLLNDFNQVVERFAQIERQEKELRADYQRQKQTFEDRKNRIQTCDDELSDKRRELLSLSGAAAQAEARRGGLEESLTQLNEDSQAAQKQLDEIQEQKESFEKRRKNLFESFEKERQTQMDILNNVDELQANKTQLVDELEYKQGEVEAF